jgi:cytochrome c oxidase subunit 2
MLFLSTVYSIPAASDTALNFDSFFNFLFIVSTLLFVITLAFGIYFVIRYQRKGAPDAEGNYQVSKVDTNHWVEWGSMFIIAVISAVIFFWGFRDYAKNIAPKMDEFEVNVLGQQWNWQITYADGKTFMNELYVPVGRPIKLVITSKDVLHSFFIPAFRVKMDAVPGLFTSLRFMPTKAGEYDIFCAENCGTSHAAMIGKVYALEQADFVKWQNGTFAVTKSSDQPAAGANAVAAAPETPAEKGAKLFKSKTCSTCHSVDGSRLVGPTWKGVWGKEGLLADGTKVLIDENYVRESILEPMKKVTKGYPPAMPTFKGLVSDQEIEYLIAYMKSLK